MEQLQGLLAQMGSLPPLNESAQLEEAVLGSDADSLASHQVIRLCMHHSAYGLFSVRLQCLLRRGKCRDGGVLLPALPYMQSTQWKLFWDDLLHYRGCNAWLLCCGVKPTGSLFWRAS